MSKIESKIELESQIDQWIKAENKAGSWLQMVRREEDDTNSRSLIFQGRPDSRYFLEKKVWWSEKDVIEICEGEDKKGIFWISQRSKKQVELLGVQSLEPLRDPTGRILNVPALRARVVSNASERQLRNMLSKNDTDDSVFIRMTLEDEKPSKLFCSKSSKQIKLSTMNKDTVEHIKRLIDQEHYNELANMGIFYTEEDRFSRIGFWTCVSPQVANLFTAFYLIDNGLLKSSK